MKKLSCIMVASLLAGCAAFQNITNPLRSPDNPNCMDMNRFKIAQVLNDGALAYECKNSGYLECSALDRWVALKTQPDLDFYDDQIVDVPKDKCAVQDGVYKYETKDKRIKTVPIIDFDYMYEATSEKEIQKRAEETVSTLKFRVYNDCRTVAKKSVDKEKCDCVSDEIVQRIITIMAKGESSYKKERSKIIKDIEKQCGTLPKEVKEIL